MTLADQLAAELAIQPWQTVPALAAKIRRRTHLVRLTLANDERFVSRSNGSRRWNSPRLWGLAPDARDGRGRPFPEVVQLQIGDAA